MTVRIRNIAFPLSLFMLSTPGASAQTATTQAATAVTDLAAVMNGSFDIGDITIFSLYRPAFEYGTTTSYGQDTNSVVLNRTSKAVSSNLSHLLPNTTYHYRLRGTLNSGTSFYGDDMSFTTGAPASPPAFKSSAASSIAPTAATLQFGIESGSSPASLMIDYGTDTNYGTQIIYPTVLPISSTNAPAIPVTSLTLGTTYHFRATATNNEGTTTSTDASFTTPPLPEVTTYAASNIGFTWTQLNGYFDMKGGAYTIAFDYGPTAAYGNSAGPYMVYSDSNGIMPQTILSKIATLTCETTYHCRLRLSDTYGNGYCGADSIFTTSSPNADNPSHDGISNLVKYALGLDPTRPGTLPSPRQPMIPTSAPHLTLQFNRLFAATDVTYEVEATSDLEGPWTTIASGSNGNPMTGPGVALQLQLPIGLQSPDNFWPRSFVEIQDPVSMSQATRRFMRLKISR